MSEVPEPTPDPGKKAAPAPGKKGRLRLLTLKFLFSALKNAIISKKQTFFDHFNRLTVTLSILMGP